MDKIILIIVIALLVIGVLAWQIPLQQARADCQTFADRYQIKYQVKENGTCLVQSNIGWVTPANYLTYIGLKEY